MLYIRNLVRFIPYSLCLMRSFHIQVWAAMEKHEGRVKDARQIYLKGDSACPQ